MTQERVDRLTAWQRGEFIADRRALRRIRGRVVAEFESGLGKAQLKARPPGRRAIFQGPGAALELAAGGGPILALRGRVAPPQRCGGIVGERRGVGSDIPAYVAYGPGVTN